METRVCRTCGALLPLFSRSSRSKILQTLVKEKKKKKVKPVKERVLDYVKTKNLDSEKLELHEIPRENEITRKPENIVEIPKEQPKKDSVTYQEIPLPKTNNSVNISEDTPIFESKKTDFLEEITPQPFKGSVIKPPRPYEPLTSKSDNTITDAFSELKHSIREEDQRDSQPKQSTSSVSVKVPDEDIIALKQKRLEKDMSNVLGFLSKKISFKKLDQPEVKPTITKEPNKVIPPKSMNEILKRLLTLDLHIEASAVIKTDGTILASAISSRISDSLFATIGINLSMIGTDIIEGLNAGNLVSISVKGTEGVLDLAPIDRNNPSVEDMILILFSHPKVKSGIISFAVSIVKKQIKAYLGI